ncbi:MAG TPA: tRNA uracil 4-sulfurtransferase ThiI [Thermodesulfobacteriota bacterium]|nr:tRNA uracil 4-sulfurtransferase ThiI [Thermodesulfobacteriota bacterium]
MLALVHYGEFVLKGRNRRLFENKLISNIKRASGGKVERLEGRLVVKNGDLDSLKNVFGISWFAPAYRTEKNLKAIEKLVIEKTEEKLKDNFLLNPTFGIFVQRADKRFPHTSPEIGERIGAEVSKKYNLKVQLKEPGFPIYIEVAKDAFVHFEKIKGLGGLPVGINNKVLCLLSGGIDSPVASYLMMKRGCNVDFIHFHAFPENQIALRGKINELISTLNKYQLESRIFLVPNYLFQLSLLKGIDFSCGYEMILFRRFMVKVAEKIAKKQGYKALVTGDSLGQVASQTLENIRVLKEATSLPILQPLISFDKEEIVHLARRIGTYGISIKPYKDCCSIIAPHPKTKAVTERVMKIEERINMEITISKTLELIDTYKCGLIADISLSS